MTIEVTQRPRPGRQRSEAADQAILGATLDVLAAAGYGSLTMASVIGKSGVSSATLYRRWPTKQQLVAAALASLHPEIVPIDSGSLESDLSELVHSIADSMSVRREDLADDVAVELRRNPEFRAAVNEKFIVPRLQVLEQILDNAGARGEIGTGLDPRVAMSFVSGPMHHRLYVLGETVDRKFADSVVIAALAALRALSPG
jgi:AcrR family transcriptional regulator